MEDRSDSHDAIHTIIGFAILGFQRLQVRRRDLERELSSIAKSVVRHSAEWIEERDEPGQ
jgi:hypothetical protein